MELPFPFHSTPPLGTLKLVAAYCVMVMWVALIAWACIAELRDHTHEQRREILFKWFSVLVCLGFGAIFIVADSPLLTKEPRPHMALTFVGVVIVAAAYSLRVLSEKYRLLRSRISRAFGICLVAMVAFGAQAGLIRGYVNNRAEQLDFVRAELIAAEPSFYRSVIVVLPDERSCISEPCGQWTGAAVDWLVVKGKTGGYRYALATLGIPPESKMITIVHQRPDVTPNDAVVIDWQKYASARRRLAGSNRFQSDVQAIQ